MAFKNLREEIEEEFAGLSVVEPSYMRDNMRRFLGDGAALWRRRLANEKLNPSLRKKRLASYEPSRSRRLEAMRADPEKWSEHLAKRRASYAATVSRHGNRWQRWRRDDPERYVRYLEQQRSRKRKRQTYKEGDAAKRFAKTKQDPEKYARWLANNRRSRENLKADPVRWEAYKAKERERARLAKARDGYARKKGKATAKGA